MGRGARPSGEFFEEGAHLADVDDLIIPANPVASGEALTVGHTTDKAPPVPAGSAVRFGELYDGLGGVVQKFIVLDSSPTLDRVSYSNSLPSAHISDVDNSIDIFIIITEQIKFYFNRRTDTG